MFWHTSPLPLSLLSARKFSNHLVQILKYLISNYLIFNDDFRGVVITRCFCPFCILVVPSLGLDVAITFFGYWELLNCHYPWELKRVASEFNILKIFPDYTKFWFGFIFALQLPNVKIRWIKHAKLQAFYLPSGFAIKDAVYPHTLSRSPSYFFASILLYCRFFSLIVQRNCDVYFHVIWFWNSVTLCSEFFQNIIFFPIIVKLLAFIVLKVMILNAREVQFRKISGWFLMQTNF